MIYPEARYSHVGTNAILPDSLGKLLKHLKTPVVSLVSHGNHLAQPVWNLKTRKVNTTADMTYLFSKEDLESLRAQAELSRDSLTEIGRASCRERV